MPMREMVAAAKKIQRQPTFCAMKPPKSAAKPEPPHEPMDQRLMARWRPSPSQYVLMSARMIPKRILSFP